MNVIEQDGVLAALFARNPDPIVLYDPDGRLIDANPAALELSGYTLEELRGVHVTVHASPRHKERVEIAARTALAGKTDHFETSIRRKSGEVVPVECFIFPATSGKAGVSCVFVIARDLVALKSAELSLGQNQERFRSLFEFHPDSILALKADGKVSRVNLALESTTGFFNEKVVGKPWTEIVAPENYAVAEEAFREAMRGESSEVDCLFLDRLGNRIDMQIKLVPLLVGSQIEGAYVIAKNVEAQRAAERAIVEQSERIRSLYMVAAGGGSTAEQIDRTLELGCATFGFEFGYLTRIDEEALTLLNVAGPRHTIQPGMVFPRGMVISSHLGAEHETIFIPNLDVPPWKETIKRLGHPWKSYFALLLRVHNKPFGSIVFADRATRSGSLADADRDLAQLMGVFIGAAIERSEHEKRVEQLAFHDALTGLPNRVLFDDRIRQTLATARRYDRGFAVMYLDLDNFKSVNDDLGHPSGDLLLRSVADRLRQTLRESDTVARFGGDEFVVLQPIVNGPTDTSDMARKIVSAMQVPFDLSGVMRTIRTSIGISLFPNDGAEIETLMDNADKALYRAKRTGRNRWVFFNEEEQRREWKR
ncbi:MAG: diguanylate cyclase [Candidatus Eremiobacteraeota bacterium]|nr:diguanylate cyclase [Candidatus Eremiobacteraeota bacterium]